MLMRGHDCAPRAPEITGKPAALGAILLLALVVRTIGPLREMALGQTDAYAHLQFLMDMLDSGRLRHPAYPPGYYWLLAVIVRLLRLDPYLVIRFAGGFFGCAMVGTLYFLCVRVFGVRAALATAFLAAAFPLFHWLQKTGVGAYPTQLGLVLLPLLLLLWHRSMSGCVTAQLALLAVAALLALSVPMMLLDLLPFLAVDACIRITRREVPRRAYVAIGMLCICFCGSLLLMLVGGGADALIRAAVFVADLQPAGDTSSAGLLFGALHAYAAPQRGLPESVLFAGAALAAGMVLCGLLAMLWQRGPLPRMLALLGVFSWAQSVFGVFQFALYMRAGWVLLLAMAALGGWVVQACIGRMPISLRRGSWVVLAATAIPTLFFPPAHKPHLSAAESDLVLVARQLEAWSNGLSVRRDFDWLAILPTQGRLQVWSRRHVGFPGYQGEPLHAFLERKQRVSLHSLTADAAMSAHFDDGLFHLVLLDDHLPRPDLSPMTRLTSRGLVEQFEQSQMQWVQGGSVLRKRLEQALSTGRWTYERRTLSQGLECVLLIPFVAACP